MRLHHRSINSRTVYLIHAERARYSLKGLIFYLLKGGNIIQSSLCVCMMNQESVCSKKYDIILHHMLGSVKTEIRTFVHLRKEFADRLIHNRF